MKNDYKQQVEWVQEAYRRIWDLKQLTAEAKQLMVIELCIHYGAMLMAYAVDEVRAEDDDEVYNDTVGLCTGEGGLRNILSYTGRGICGMDLLDDVSGVSEQDWINTMDEAERKKLLI